MKQKTYQQYHKSFQLRVRGCYLLALVLVCVCTALAAGLLHSEIAVWLVLVEGLLFFGLLHMLYHIENEYVSQIVTDLSKLLDQLMELEQAEVFPENEDTLVSKLQTQIVRLIHILQKQNELEKREHENIKGLVSDLSHQLKTPLSNLKMYTEFLNQKELSEEQRLEYVKVLEISLQRLLFLSESMIKVSRLERGLVHLNQQEESINQTILMAIKNAYAKAKESHVEIKYQEDYQGSILHDSTWTAEAIYNLIDNAIKYGTNPVSKAENDSNHGNNERKDGNKEILVSIRSLGAMIEIAVEDQNTLIPEEEYTKIFQRFYRGNSAKSVEDGVGIGLYLTREIITQQGGYVSVKKGAVGNRFVILMRG